MSSSGNADAKRKKHGRIKGPFTAYVPVQKGKTALLISPQNASWVPSPRPFRRSLKGSLSVTCVEQLAECLVHDLRVGQTVQARLALNGLHPAALDMEGGALLDPAAIPGAAQGRRAVVPPAKEFLDLAAAQRLIDGGRRRPPFLFRHGHTTPLDQQGPHHVYISIHGIHSADNRTQRLPDLDIGVLSIRDVDRGVQGGNVLQGPPRREGAQKKGVHRVQVRPEWRILHLAGPRCVSPGVFLRGRDA